MGEKLHNFEVLIAALNGDLNIYEKSNLHCHCIIANQSDCVAITEEGNTTMITTNTRGVGKNRNISLIYSSAEYILFGDDDVTYVDDLESIIVSEFESNKKADVLIFNIETVGSEEIKRRVNSKYKRVNTLNYMNYGAVRIACRRDSIRRCNIWFSELFGGGATYSAGEDTKFLADCLRHKLNVFTVPIKIGVVDQSKSSWFSGYNEKYFKDKGALLKSIYPHKYKIFCLYFSFKMRTKDRSFMKNYSDCIKGARDYDGRKRKND